jgi:ParB-like chromosome segregation protein Spo0J
MKTEKIDLDFIDIVGPRRPVRAADVDRLAESMSKIGLQTPISIRYFPDRPGLDGTADSMVLVAGAHRLAAAKKLGWDSINCVVLDFGDVEAELWEISENLHRAELSALERDEQIAKWVDLVGRKRVQPEQVSVGGRGNKGGEAQASRELGLSRPDVHRAVKVAALAPEAKKAARAAGLDDNRSALLEAAKEKTPATQVNVIKGIAALKQDTRKKKKSRKPRWAPPKSTPEQRDEFDLQGIQAFWEMASDNARAAFLKSVRSEPARGPAAICDRVREAILILSGLPPTHKVAGWFVGTDAAIIISERLRPAAAWLAEFSDAWKDDQ